MQNPMRTLREPMGVEIGDQQSGLEEDEAGDPDRGRAAEAGSSCLAAMGSTRKRRNEARKTAAAKERSRTGHCVPQAMPTMDLAMVQMGAVRGRIPRTSAHLEIGVVAM